MGTKITNSLAIFRLRKPLKTSTRLAGHGIWTRDLSNASLVRYHRATSLGNWYNCDPRYICDPQDFFLYKVKIVLLQTHRHRNVLLNSTPPSIYHQILLWLLKKIITIKVSALPAVHSIHITKATIILYKKHLSLLLYLPQFNFLFFFPPSCFSVIHTMHFIMGFLFNFNLSIGYPKNRKVKDFKCPILSQCPLYQIYVMEKF